METKSENYTAPYIETMTFNIHNTKIKPKNNNPFFSMVIRTFLSVEQRQVRKERKDKCFIKQWSTKCV